MRYISFFEHLLTESPDNINNAHGASLYFPEDCRYTFILYFDEISKKPEYIAFDTYYNEIISSNNDIVSEVTSPERFADTIEDRKLVKYPSGFSSTYLTPEIKNFQYDKKTVDYILERIRNWPSHRYLWEILRILRRKNEPLSRQSAFLDGRIFSFGKKYFCSFWQEEKSVKPQKNLLDEMFRDMEFDINTLFIELDNDEKCISYHEYFKEKEPEISNASREKEKELLYKLHMMKANLPGKWQQAMNKLTRT